MEKDPERSRSIEDEKDAAVIYEEQAKIDDYKGAAIDAENEEHNMTVLQAVKAYPMASFWAFVMSCTIVRCHIHLVLSKNETSLRLLRSWNPTTSF